MWIILIYFSCLIATVVIWLRVKSEDSSWNDYIIAIYNVLFLTVMLICHYNSISGVRLFSSDWFYNLLKAIYSAASTVTFDGFVEPIGKYRNYKMLIMVAAPLLTVANVVIGVFFQKAMDRWREEIDLRFTKEVFVLRGSLEDIKTMTNEIYNQKENACVVVIPTTYLDETAFHNALVSDDSFFEQIIPGKKTYHIVLMPDEESRNMELLHLMDNQAGKYFAETGLIYDNGKSRREKECSASERRDELERLISSIMVVVFVENDTLRYDNIILENIKYKLLSTENTTINKTIRENPPIHFFVKDGHPIKNKTTVENNVVCFTEKMHLCIIGFSALAQEFFAQTFENTYYTIQNSQDWAMEVHVFDWQECERTLFLDRCPYFRDSDIIIWEENSFEQEGIRNHLIKYGIDYYDEILIAHDNTNTNYSEAKDLMRFILADHASRREENLVKPFIVIDLGDYTALNTPIFQKYNGEPDRKGENHYYVLPGNIEAFRYDVLIDWTEEETSAKEFNETYKEQSQNAMDWIKMDYFTRMSNYAVAKDTENKRQLTTLDSASIKDCSEDVRNHVYQKLAEYEHRRWMAFHFTRGWVPITPERLQQSSGYTEKTTKILEAKMHLLLVPAPEIRTVLGKLGREKESETVMMYNLSFVRQSLMEKPQKQQEGEITS